MWKVLDPVKKE
jgi:hypothetical protein